MDKQQPNSNLEVNTPGPSDLVSRYHRLLEMTLDLVSTLDLRALLQQIVDAARELTQSEAASLLLHDPKSNLLHFEAATKPIERDLSKIFVPVENSIAGQIFREKQPLSVNNASDDHRLFREVDDITQFRTHSIMGVPLMVKNKAVGVIEVINKLDGQFNADDIQLLEFLAAQAAIAIENTRLFQQNDLIAEIVHELRTPLNALVAAAHLLRRPELSHDQQEQLSQTISSEVNRLNEMATDFLEFSRLESGRVQLQLERIDMAGLIRECSEVIRPQALSDHLKLKIKVDSNLPVIQGDRNRLKRLLLNLLTNAIKYNSPDGTVTVRASKSEDAIHLQVQDNGIGIPEELLPNIFERFFRAPSDENRIGGTGLGLAIAKRITQTHGGEIWVESKPGQGSTFHVKLPIEPSPRLG
ncbi:MAG: ATP-binding protein [Anaerolineales bacterium]|jgi:signal transduction histidine kinase